MKRIAHPDFEECNFVNITNSDSVNTVIFLNLTEAYITSEGDDDWSLNYSLKCFPAHLKNFKALQLLPSHVIDLDQRMSILSELKIFCPYDLIHLRRAGVIPAAFPFNSFS